MNKYATKKDFLNRNTDNLRNIFSNYSNKCKYIVIVTGFLTEKGFKELINSIDPKNIKKIKKIIVGVYTISAQKAFEYIKSNKEYSHIKLFLFNNRTLTDSYKKDSSKDDKTIRFTPILHAKIIAGYDKGLVWAYTGSANITDFAYNDKNIESGVFLNNNTLLKSIHLRIKNITATKNILNFEKLKNKLICIPTRTDPDIYQIELSREGAERVINKTYIMFINNTIKKTNINLVGLFSKSRNDLPETIFSLNTKIILIFNDNNILPTIVTAPSGTRDILKDPKDIDLYLNSKTGDYGRGLFIEDSYFSTPENMKFAILQGINNPKTIEEYKKNPKDLERLSNIFNININEEIEGHNIIKIQNAEYKKHIIIESAKQNVKLDQDKIKDGVFNMNNLQIITTKKELTLNDLKHNDQRLCAPIILKIKTD